MEPLQDCMNEKSEFELSEKPIWFYGERFSMPLNYRLINSKFNS